MAKKPPAKPDLSYIAESLRPLALPIADLTPDPDNARLHDENNLAAIQGSLAEFGQVQPLVVQQEGLIVRVGNGRLEAARRLGWTHLAAVVVSGSDPRMKALAVADNRTAELASWDADVYRELLAEISVGNAELQQMYSSLADQLQLYDVDIEASDENLPAIVAPESHTVVVRYTDAEAHYLATFLDVADLPESNLGKSILERIKTVAAN
jgi:ParB-like chromosome segregation protein Spo0J